MRFFSSLRSVMRAPGCSRSRNTRTAGCRAGRRDEALPSTGADEERPDDAPDPEERLLQQHTVALVRSALEQLPVDFREVIVLREIEGLSYKEIAAVVRVPIGTVMSRLARARERLVAVLKLAAPMEILR